MEGESSFGILFMIGVAVRDLFLFFFFSSRRRHTRFDCDWSSDVCSSDLRRRAAERKELRREYELKVQSGEWPIQETKVPLFPYQREGMLHLAFSERALRSEERRVGKECRSRWSPYH